MMRCRWGVSQNIMCLPQGNFLDAVFVHDLYKISVKLFCKYFLQPASMLVAVFLRKHARKIVGVVEVYKCCLVLPFFLPLHVPHPRFGFVVSRAPCSMYILLIRVTFFVAILSPSPHHRFLLSVASVTPVSCFLLRCSCSRRYGRACASLRWGPARSSHICA